MKFLNTTVIDKTDSFLYAKIFQTGIRICKGFLDIYLVFVVNGRWKRDGCRWRFFRNFIEDFFNVSRKVYIIMEIVSSNMNYEIVWLFLDYFIQFF